jgi:rhodanese-related sulfurtransferase
MKDHSPGFLELVREAKSDIHICSVEQIKDKLDNSEKINLIDVREDHEWAAGRLPGARHLSKGIIERDIEKLYPDKQTELFLYCGGGYRSALAAHNLIKMGYNNVVSVEGGYSAWKEAGFELAHIIHDPFTARD